MMSNVTPRRYRVIQWYTGQIAQEQIRLISQARDIDLVGGVCKSSAKKGMDLGLIAGIQPLGVVAIHDPEKGLAIDADIVLLAPAAPEFNLIERILESGKNVISLLGPWDVRAVPEYRRLHDAAVANGVSLFGSGNIPGMVNDFLPIVLSGFLQNIRYIHAGERNFHNHYSSAGVLQDQIGYGRPPEDHAATSSQGSAMRDGYLWSFHQSHHAMAKALGWLDQGETFESRMPESELALAAEDIEMAAAAFVIRKGTVAGVHYRIDSYIDGELRLTTGLQHSCRPGIAPGWRASEDEDEFYFEIDADPPIKGGWRMKEDECRLTGTVHLNAARNVNLIPHVVAAPAGNITFADLPLVVPVPMKAAKC